MVGPKPAKDTKEKYDKAPLASGPYKVRNFNDTEAVGRQQCGRWSSGSSDRWRCAWTGGYCPSTAP
ncbi:hypothetical protein KN815_38785, partial [Streptomyces sp. 4503]